MTDYEKLAELLYPEITKTPEDLEKIYPERGLSEGARVSRFAPSPTGCLHLGGIFASMVARLTTRATDDGVFILRIEDTDKKREIEDGVSAIIQGLTDFGMEPDEGVIGFNSERGDYGPYKAVNYHRWDVCKAAVVLGKAKDMPVYKFLREPLIRKFGEEWYKELEIAVEELRQQNYI